MMTRLEKSTADGAAIPCHCCLATAPLARSVMIRGDVLRAAEEIPEKWKDNKYLASMPAEEAARFDRFMEQYRRNGEYRRAFICNPCYSRLDNDVGMAEIMTPLGPQTFNLAGASRGGKAAVYTAKKWSRFQERAFLDMTHGKVV